MGESPRGRCRRQREPWDLSGQMRVDKRRERREGEVEMEGKRREGGGFGR